jgi:hypothetical protein
MCSSAAFSTAPSLPSTTSIKRPFLQVEQGRRRLSPIASEGIQLRGGAICFPQHFGGSVNLNVHYHVAVPGGVFARQVSNTKRPTAHLDVPSAAAGRPIEFVQLPMPEASDLEQARLEPSTRGVKGGAGSRHARFWLHRVGR